MGRTTIEVSEEVRDELRRFKSIEGYTYDEAIGELLGYYPWIDVRETEADGHVEVREVDREPAESADMIDAVLRTYDQGRNREEREERRAAARAALEWLRDRGRPASGEDFREELLPELEIAGQSPTTWWRRTIRPALQEAAEAGLVEYRAGHHDYTWIDG